MPVTVVMVPASIQVCEPGDLAYYPRVLDINDSSRFDLEQPQRIIAELAEPLGWSFADLRPALQSADRCPYQPHNMHWLEHGHELVADYVGNVLIEEAIVQASP